MVIHSIELCAGVGMLGEGVRAALEFYGWQHRTVAYVERETAAAAQLVALMESECLDAAPIWPDLTTFDGEAWRGKVDCVIAGFPCQDMSVAGKRVGLDGARSGLFFNVCQIADDCGAWLLILENVAGIASATASVVDEAEGELDERAASRVVGELADRGWNAEWLHLSASDVGASHGRERWFCFSWRMGNTGLQHQHIQQREDGAEYQGAGINVDDSECPERRPLRSCGTGGIKGHDGVWREANCGAGVAEQALADTNGIGRWAESNRKQQPGGANLGRLSIFAPGPAAAEWAGIISASPWLAPATEPGVCMLVDGLALMVDESRNHQLRQVGNGVVPLCAAAAIVEIMRRAGVKRA
jgi:DNA (cytosine-5)-methyltransferase 1